MLIFLVCFSYGGEGPVSLVDQLVQSARINADKILQELAILVLADYPVLCHHKNKFKYIFEITKSKRLTVEVHDLEENLGQHLDPDGEVGQPGRAVAQAAPHVEPLSQADGLDGLFPGCDGRLPVRDNLGFGVSG